MGGRPAARDVSGCGARWARGEADAGLALESGSRRVVEVPLVGAQSPLEVEPPLEMKSPLEVGPMVAVRPPLEVQCAEEMPA